MSLYAYGRTELSHLSTPALNIIHRWQSIVYNLSYNYDKSNHDAKQRDLRERISAKVYREVWEKGRNEGLE